MGLRSKTRLPVATTDSQSPSNADVSMQLLELGVACASLVVVVVLAVVR